MDDIREIIEHIFLKKSIPNSNMNKITDLENINAKYFDDLRSSFFYKYGNKYTKEEVELIQEILISKYVKLPDIGAKDNLLNILAYVGNLIFTEKDDNPICKYKELLRWRDLSFKLGEDIFTTSYFAYTDIKCIKKRNYFNWKPVIGNDNKLINNMLKKGMTENHYHLKGSAPVFNVTWISLMNNIVGRKNDFERFGVKGELFPNSVNNIKTITALGLKPLVEKAFMIRYMLFLLINEDIDEDEIKRIKLGILSEYENEISACAINIQSSIDVLKEIYGKKIEIEGTNNRVYDYAIPKNISNRDKQNIFLSGERYFMYSVFRQIYSGKESIYKYSDYFYLYLLIKEKLRKEMLQINNKIGFTNFADYQDRKTVFLNNSKISDIYMDSIYKLGINSVLENESILDLEVRIAPKASEDKLSSEINKIDNLVSIKNEKIKENFFYTIHFIKQPEKFENYKKQNISLNYTKSRHYELRKLIEKQALALYNYKNNISIKQNLGIEKYENRIFGIDAANKEIYCRPEVFGTVFRYLKNNSDTKFSATFHVGEDYIDVVGGLRAIDESIMFLNLSLGDRLGHALALGVNCEEYYRLKGKKIINYKQNLLDNLVWIKYMANKNNLISSELPKIEDKINNYISEIYGFSREGINYNDYLKAWKLRGDDPKIYFSEESFEEWYEAQPMDYYRYNNIGIDADKLRNQESVRSIYRDYHYSDEVKRKGAEIDEMIVTDEYIELVIKIQEKMQFNIANMKISIETNPSSNYVIGSFKRYDKHPILKFYNMYIGTPQEQKKSAQINVSINTDDQGIFGTYIENEYALLALALEKMKDENGNMKYKSIDINNWLDSIREMGNEQSFRDK